MFNKVSLFQRFNTGMALAMVFLLVLATNRIDQHHFETAQSTMNSMFEDRVVSQYYIYKINDIISNKRILLLEDRYHKPQVATDKVLDDFILQLAATDLTKRGSKQFTIFQNIIEELKTAENLLINNENIDNFKFYIEVSDKLGELQTVLGKLSAIQLEESKNLNVFAKKSLDNTNLISIIEIGFLIIVGIIIQLVIFYRVEKKS